MKFSFLTLPAIILLAGSIPPGQSRPQFSPCEIKINPSVSFGVWEGWGTSLAWMGKVFGDRDDLADVLFTTKLVDLDGEKLPGLGMNIARYNAGACSWNELKGNGRMAVSKKIQRFRQMEGYWLDPRDTSPDSSCWNWSVDANQRAMLLKARDRGANRFELFSNSPMWWMCRNNNPSGAADGKNDNQAPEKYPAFATYLATIAARAKSNWGIVFTSVEPFNEPITNYWNASGKQEGCHFDAASQVAFLPVLRAALDSQGLSALAIAASDENGYDDALRVWQSFPPQTRALVNRFNVHGYSLQRGNRAGIYQAVAKEADKPIWNTEYGDKFRDGLEMARNIHRDMASLHPAAWCYWQPLDGGNDGGWGLIAADLGRGTIGKANPKYFVLAQYTRHIRLGMTILDCREKNTIAAYDSRACTLVIAALNDGPARDVVFDLSMFRVSDGPVDGFVTEPGGAVLYQPSHRAVVRKSRLAVKFPAYSIQTFEIHSAELPPDHARPAGRQHWNLKADCIAPAYSIFSGDRMIK